MRLILGVILSVVLVVSFMSVYATEQNDIEKLEIDIEKQQKKINTFQRINDRLQSLIDLTQSRIDEKLDMINGLKNENDAISVKDGGNGYCVANCDDSDLERNKQLEMQDDRWASHINPEKIETTKTTDNTLEKFPYNLEQNVIYGHCKVSILGFIETVGETRNTYKPKAYAKNIGSDVASCGINPPGNIILKSIHAETENGLDLSVYSHNVWNKGLSHPLYPGDEWFDTFNNNFGSFELNHDDKVKRIVINFNPDKGNSYNRYFEFKIIE